MRRVVCADLRAKIPHSNWTEIVTGPRHYDKTMRGTIDMLGPLYYGAFLNPGRNVEQGFVDQDGVFMSREEALKVARAAGQVVREVGGGDTQLFSEMLY